MQSSVMRKTWTRKEYIDSKSCIPIEISPDLAFLVILVLNKKRGTYESFLKFPIDLKRYILPRCSTSALELFNCGKSDVDIRLAYLEDFYDLPA